MSKSVSTDVCLCRSVEYLSSGEPSLEVCSGSAQRDRTLFQSSCRRQVSISKALMTMLHLFPFYFSKSFFSTTLYVNDLCYDWLTLTGVSNSLSIERQLGSLILATDISRQNEYLSRFRTHLDENDLCLGNASHRHFVLQVGICNSALITLKTNIMQFIYTFI